MFPQIKQSGQVLLPVEIHIPSDKLKPTTPLPGSGSNAQHGFLSSGSNSSTYSANPLASLGDSHNLDMDHVNPELGPPTPFQESLNKPPKNLSKQTPVIGYKKLSRDNAVAVLQKLNSREALQASRGILASGLIDPMNPAASSAKMPKPYTRERKYSKQVVSKPTIGSIAAMQRRKKSGRGRELNVKSSVDDVKAFRKSIIPPAAMLGIVKDEFHEFVSVADGPSAADSPGQQAPGAETTVNPFFVLCDDVTNSLAEFESAMQSFALWKNDFLKQNVTSSVKLTLALMVAKIIRSQSDLSQLVLEMVRTVRTYSAHWSDKINAIMELEQEHARQARAFDIAIRKIESMHGQVTRGKINRQIFMWEYITKKLLRRAQEREMFGRSEDDDDNDDDDNDEGRIVGVSQSQMVSASQAMLTNEQVSGTDYGRVEKRVSKAHGGKRRGGGMGGATKVGKMVSVSEQQLDDVSGIPGGRGRRAAGNDQRLEGIRAMLDAKRRERAELGKSKQDEIQVPEGIVREQRFNELINKHHPFLARAIYVLTNHEVHLPMYYASEVFMLDYGPAVLTESSALNQSTAGKSKLSLVVRNHRTPNWTAEDAVELSKPISLRGLVRSNSTNAIFMLGKKARETFAPLKEQELMQKASDALLQAAKARLPPHSYHFDQAFRLSSPDKPNSAPNTMEAAAAAVNIDLNKTWFTLQDVLELSLLHMQQIQCLRGQYEQTVHDLTQLNAQNNVIPKNWQYAADPPSQSKSAEKRKSVSSMTPTRRKSTPSTPTMPQTPAPRRRTANGPKHRPMQLNSSLLNLNFMERMSRLASKSEKRKADLAEEIVRREMENNLTRAVRDKRQVFTKDQVVELMERVIPAVFMPLPEKEAADAANSFPSRPPSHVMDKMRRSPVPPRTSSSDNGNTTGFDLLELARSISRPGSSKEYGRSGR